MSVIVDFSLPTEAFALTHTFRESPKTVIEIERLATHSREWVMPFLWATDDEPEPLGTVLEDDPSVTEVTTIDRTADVGLYNVRWSEDVMAVVDAIVDQHGIILEARASGGEWHMKLRFLEKQNLETFQSYFDDHGYTFEIHRLTTEDEPKHREFGLTPAQHEVLVTALEVGYFDIPRETNISELAETLGISANAVSQRLRRASANLVSNALTMSAYK